MNDFQNIMLSAWNLINIEFTLYGFTLSYGKVFLFTILSSLLAYAIFKALCDDVYR